MKQVQTYVLWLGIPSFNVLSASVEDLSLKIHLLLEQEENPVRPQNV